MVLINRFGYFLMQNYVEFNGGGDGRPVQKKSRELEARAKKNPLLVSFVRVGASDFREITMYILLGWSCDCYTGMTGEVAVMMHQQVKTVETAAETGLCVID